MNFELQKEKKTKERNDHVVVRVDSSTSKDTSSHRIEFWFEKGSEMKKILLKNKKVKVLN
jgi:hypothetical protein